VSIWSIIMVSAGGLFAGGAATFAWSRVPIWRTMPTAAFVDDFARTISRTDKVQPTLLIVAIVASAGVAATHAGLSRVLALVGAVGFLVVLIASLAVLVPLQRRIIGSPDSEALGEMRERWFGGNLGRSTLSVIAFVATAVAASAA
jgi:anthrone oxygenase-like protein